MAKLQWQSFCESIKLPEGLLFHDLKVAVREQILLGSNKELVVIIEAEGAKRKIHTQWKGLITFIEEDLLEKGDKSRFTSMDFVRWELCPLCQGARLKQESLYCLINGINIAQMCHMPIFELLGYFHALHLEGRNELIAKDLIHEVVSRLEFLQKVGLEYLELDRPANTLSEGESQRVQLAAIIGAKLSGILYVLDEPSLGLHPQDVLLLANVIKRLRDIGNSVLLVEHDRKLISEGEHIIEIGPGSGVQGGHVVFQGTFDELLVNKSSATGLWMSGHHKITKTKIRKASHFLKVHKANLHNLKNLSFEIPLGVFVVLCGVSGSGKSTLALDIISEELRNWFREGRVCPHLEGYERIQQLNFLEQGAAGINSRSIVATYTDIMGPLRELFASTKLAKARGYSAARFSLNKRGGRCDACDGLGTIKINMQLMADMNLPCDLCAGQRYNFETLQVTWEGFSIAQILNLSVAEAYQLFKYHPKLSHKLELMNELGLSYLTLGQSFDTLSGGEIQRLKLVADLSTHNQLPTLYVLDEPSAGLHFQDVQKLMEILHRLVQNGHTVIAIEHNLEIIKQADWVIELGPVGGPDGGHLIFQGTPAQLTKSNTPTANALKE